MLPFLLCTQTLPAMTLPLIIRPDSGSHWISEGGECLDHLTGHARFQYSPSLSRLQAYKGTHFTRLSLRDETTINNETDRILLWNVLI